MAIIETFTAELEGYHAYQIHTTGEAVGVSKCIETLIVTYTAPADRNGYIQSYSGGGSGDCLLTLRIDGNWYSEYRTSITDRTAIVVFPEPLKVPSGSTATLSVVHNNKFGTNFRGYINGFEE